MKAKLVIVPIDEYEKIYKKTITTASESYEINNFSCMNGIAGGLEQLMKNSYLVMVSNGYYNKIYLSDKCSLFQKAKLLEFLMESVNASFAKVIIYPNNGTNAKEINGNMSIVDIEKFINSNVRDINNDYRVPENNYSDSDEEKIK